MINTEHDVIRFMKRFPDKITTARMVSKTWKCSTCLTEFKQNKEVVIPAPCKNCGGIFFEKLS
ncbi:MAG TPA: hypothetical protein VFC79_02220 [Tissierellaceae bacterium]|nr:hypothetical protein [Tissierellaceae bacterium]